MILSRKCTRIQLGSCLDNENFIDVQRVAGFLPEIFFTNKQMCSKYCSVSKLPQEEMVLMKEESIEPD